MNVAYRAGVSSNYHTLDGTKNAVLIIVSLAMQGMCLWLPSHLGAFGCPSMPQDKNKRIAHLPILAYVLCAFALALQALSFFFPCNTVNASETDTEDVKRGEATESGQGGLKNCAAFVFYQQRNKCAAVYWQVVAKVFVLTACGFEGYFVKENPSCHDPLKMTEEILPFVCLFFCLLKIRWVPC